MTCRNCGKIREIDPPGRNGYTPGRDYDLTTQTYLCAMCVFNVSLVKARLTQ